MCSKGGVTLWLEASHSESPPCQVWCNRPCDRRNVKDLICHVTLQDHMIEGHFDFMEGSFL